MTPIDQILDFHRASNASRNKPRMAEALADAQVAFRSLVSAAKTAVLVLEAHDLLSPTASNLRAALDEAGEGMPS